MHVRAGRNVQKTSSPVLTTSSLSAFSLYIVYRVFVSHSSRNTVAACQAVVRWLIEQETSLKDDIFLDVDPHRNISRRQSATTSACKDSGNHHEIREYLRTSRSAFRLNT